MQKMLLRSAKEVESVESSAHNKRVTPLTFRADEATVSACNMDRESSQSIGARLGAIDDPIRADKFVVAVTAEELRLLLLNAAVGMASSSQSLKERETLRVVLNRMRSIQDGIGKSDIACSKVDWHI